MIKLLENYNRQNPTLNESEQKIYTIIQSTIERWHRATKIEYGNNLTLGDIIDLTKNIYSEICIEEERQAVINYVNATIKNLGRLGKKRD